MIKKILLAGLLSAAVLIPVAAQRNSDSFADSFTDECVFPNLELPDEFVVYAAGGYDGIPLDFQIEQESGLMADSNRSNCQFSFKASRANARRIRCEYLEY